MAQMKGQNNIQKEFAKKASREIENRPLPNHLVFFVTNKCNLQCSHCFYIDELNSKTRELDIDEIRKIASLQVAEAFF